MRLERAQAPRPTVVRIAVVGLAFGLAFALVYYVTVRTHQGRLFGDASLRGAMLTRSSLARGTETILDVVSVASLSAAVALVATIALVRLERASGLVAIGLLAGANVSTWALKDHLLERPDLGLVEATPATLNSLPSGHTTAVFSAVAALLLVVPARLRYPVALAGLAASTLTALATMSAGWHRAGDSMAAFLLVGVWTAGAAAALLVIDPSGTRDAVPFTWPPSARWLAVLSTTWIAIGVALGAALNAAAPVRDATPGSWVAFLVSSLLIAGVGIAVLLGMLHVLASMDRGVSTGAGAQRP